MRTYRYAPDVDGVLKNRLLVNGLVDPAEAARRLPAGLRPLVVDGATVVGCCLLEVTALRPVGLPAAVGVSQLAAAHRIAVEWDADGSTASGVFVVERRTNARTVIAASGRAFPGVFGRAAIRRDNHATSTSWSVRGGDMAIDAVEYRNGSPRFDAASGFVAATCIGADIGLSLGRSGDLEVAMMVPATRDAVEVEVETHSSFIASFPSATAAPSFLMQNVAVRWSPGRLTHAVAA